MAVYVIIDIQIKDEGPYYEYIDKVYPIIDKYNGRYLVRGGEITPLSNNWNPERIIVIEFPSAGDVERCFGSPEYKEIAPLREGSTMNKSIIVQGVLTNNLSVFLQESEYIDFSSPLIADRARQLFKGISTDAEKAKIAYEYVRDEISHSFDIKAKIITARASDVLKFQTGICHAKANLLAALLRREGIPVGMCFQHLTLLDDDSFGYCVHCFNAIYINNRWFKVDARGNTNGKNAQFSLGKPILAFPNRQDYNEYFWPGIYANPHNETMKMLEKATCLQDVLDNIPDDIDMLPDIIE